MRAQFNHEGRVLLLPHLGKERFPGHDSKICGWPQPGARHRRKFLHTEGKWRDLREHEGNESVEMWTEYEAPTSTNRLNARGAPEYVHEIISKVEKPTINTDPWIFHPDFVWTTCRHKKADDARAGDIVLFGSVVEGNWVLDTVFVIDNRLENIPKGKFGLAYDVLVGDTFKTKQCPRPFVGKPFQATHKPFSFKCLSG